MKRRAIHRNEHFLYKRKDSRTGELVFSTIPEKAPVKVYDRDYWWSDNWNPMDYARDYDWNRPFFEQFIELSREVPWFSRSIINLINSDYCANAGFLRNCYLIFNSNENEDCAYGVGIHSSKDSFDNYELDFSELCHQCFMVKKSYRTFFSSHCKDCQDVYFSQDLANCQNCFACSNLRNKKYHIFNKSYSKEEYFEKLKEFDIGSFENTAEFQKRAQDFWLQFPQKFIHGIKNVNVGGDYISYSKNIFDSFVMNGCEDCRFCVAINTASAKDCYDYTFFGKGAELVYESSQVGIGVSNLKFCAFCYPDCRGLQYCFMCHSSSDLFGCMGLRNKQYCILNKQYTKEEYEELVPKIIEHMNTMPYKDKKGRVYKYGEFFPSELSPFAYNETITQEYFPLTKEQALAQGYSWYDCAAPEHKPTITAADLPDNIEDVKDTILDEIIQCANSDQSPDLQSQCTTAFKVIPQELEFYRKMNLPLPRLCPNCRHYQRIKQRNPLKLWKRQCQCAGAKSENSVYANTATHVHAEKPCPNEFQTTYASERKEIVYCEKCYLDEVV